MVYKYNAITPKKKRDILLEINTNDEANHVMENMVTEDMIRKSIEKTQKNLLDIQKSSAPLATKILILEGMK